MERVRITEMAAALGIPSDNLPDDPIGGVSTDSRTIAAGELFVAIRGERFDGHDYVDDAFLQGAAAALVARDARIDAGGRALLEVGDTLDAFQELAGWYRRQFDLKVVGVTGTNGKTTTKDMAAAVLETSMRTAKTAGNYNNHIGVPLTLFRLTREHGAAVVEIGMNHPGEITRLAGIARPQTAVITNVAEAHMETMGTLEAIAEAKGEILDALPSDGVAILNADDTMVMSQEHRAPFRVVTFGTAASADVRATGIEEADGRVRFEVVVAGGKPVRVELPVPGAHNVSNALAAIAVGRALGVTVGEAARGLSSFEPSPMRMKVLTVGSWTVLNDAYNCNPGSLGAALRTLIDIGRGRTTAAALGDMLELGSRSETAHREVGAAAASLGVDYLFLFGREVEALRDGALDAGMDPERASVFEDKAALARALGERLGDDAVLLVKGSRGMRMEEVVELLT
jgi:UDP-N-acetylmuramoyl-tripeptide--D-alanyl-D-alanine ligase